ncbi:unnamed protein product, partial [marine sediment metagenome]
MSEPASEDDKGIHRFLDATCEHKASDLHLKVGAP